MAYYNAPMTKLEAVNICLSAMGEPVINSLDNASVDAQMASDLVDEMSRTIQSRGWYWNRERHTITPNFAGEIVLPANIIRIDTIEYDRATEVVQRGLKLFNKEDNSFQFTLALTVEMYVILPFEDLPLAARLLISYRAARVLQERLLGSSTLSGFAKDAEQSAFLTLLQEETEVGDYNMLHDSWQTQSIITRGTFSRGGY